MENKDSTVPNMVFIKHKNSRRVTTILCILVSALMVYTIFFNPLLFDASLLKELLQLSMSGILAIVAVAISVFQSDNSICGEGNLKERKREVYLRYIFLFFRRY